MRALILIHRYLGIAVGPLMLVWCLSGIVMLYVPYPHVNERTRVHALSRIDWAQVSPVSWESAEADSGLSAFQLEEVAGQLVLRLWPPGGDFKAIDASSGAILFLRAEQAVDVAVRYASARGHLVGQPAVELISYDQWTVGGAVADRPLYRVALGDSAGTEVYVSSRSGAVVQATTGTQRFWGWVGAVPHWLYPSILRSRPAVWSKVVISTALLGAFLTLCGIIIGVTACMRGASMGRSSPYRGVMLCHHLSGLLFGGLALTWALSGLFSMNPLGLMAGTDVAQTGRQVAGGAISKDDMRTLLMSLATHAPAGVQALSSAPLNADLFAVAAYADGSRVRYDTQGTITPLAHADVSAAARRLAGPGSTADLLTGEDDFYYSVDDEPAALPVIRVRSTADNYYYLDPVSAGLVSRAEPGDRAYRWWHLALHRWDSSRLLRSAFGRTAIVLPMLLGTTVLCSIGCFLAWRHLMKPSRAGEYQA